MNKKRKTNLTRVQAKLGPADRAWEAHTVEIQHTGATFAPRLMPSSAWTRVQAEDFNPTNTHKEPLCTHTQSYTRVKMYKVHVGARALYSSRQTTRT